MENSTEKRWIYNLQSVVFKYKSLNTVQSINHNFFIHAHQGFNKYQTIAEEFEVNSEIFDSDNYEQCEFEAMANNEELAQEIRSDVKYHFSR